MVEAASAHSALRTSRLLAYGRTDICPSSRRGAEASAIRRKSDVVAACFEG